MKLEKMENILPELCDMISEAKDIIPFLEDPPSDHVGGVPVFDFTEIEYEEEQDVFKEFGVSICLNKDGTYSVGKVKSEYWGGNTIIDVSKNTCDHLIAGTFHTHPIFGNYPSTVDVNKTLDDIDFICIGGKIAGKGNVKCYEPKTSFSDINKRVFGLDDEEIYPEVNYHHLKVVAS